MRPHKKKPAARANAGRPSETFCLAAERAENKPAARILQLILLRRRSVPPERAEPIAQLRRGDTAVTVHFVAFRREQARPPRRVVPGGTHQIFLWPAIERRRRHRRISWSVQETRAGADWWAWIADAYSFGEALQIARDHLEPGFDVLLTGNFESARCEGL
jgi:hypothetical protein